MTSPAVETSEPLGREAVRAVAWNYASFASGKVLVIATMAILARLLTPEEFGVVGFATLVIAYLAVLKDLGFGAALIQRTDDVDDAADTVFAVNLALGAVLTAATFAAAPAVAAFFDEPMVTPLLRLLSFTFVLESLGSIQLVLLKKSLQFRRKLVPDVGGALVKGTVSIACALSGLGAWALAWGQMAGVVTSVALAWVVMRTRPRPRIHRRLLRPLARFGGPLIVSDIQYAIWANLDYVVVGRMLGEAALGVYTLAYRLPELLIQSIWRVLANALFPVFAKVQHSLEALRRGFLASIRYTQALVVPLCVGMFITAGPAVRVLFGDQWDTAIPVLRVMAIFSLVASIGVNSGDVYKAMGRTGVLAKLGTLELFLLVPALLIGADYGIVGVAWAHAMVATVDTLVRLIVANRIVGTTFREVWRQLRPSFLSGAWLAAVASLALWGASAAGDLVALAAATVAGATAYTLAMARLDRDITERVMAWLRRRRVAA